MILSGSEFREKIPGIVRDILRRYVPDAPEDSLQRITDRCGIPLEGLTRENAPAFLECMREELAGFTEEWKAGFVTGVVGQMIAREGSAGDA